MKWMDKMKGNGSRSKWKDMKARATSQHQPIANKDHVHTIEQADFLPLDCLGGLLITSHHYYMEKGNLKALDWTRRGTMRQRETTILS